MIIKLKDKERWKNKRDKQNWQKNRQKEIKDKNVTQVWSRLLIAFCLTVKVSHLLFIYI